MLEERQLAAENRSADPIEPLLLLIFLGSSSGLSFEAEFLVDAKGRGIDIYIIQ